MDHLWMIIVFGAVLLRDSLESPPLRLGYGPWVGAATMLAPMAVLAMITQVVLSACGKRVYAGSRRAVLVADLTLRRTRLLAVLVHASGVLLFGWLDAVRAVIGDVVALDELAALAPILLTLAHGWWAMAPIERHVRDSALIGDLDTGRPVYPSRGRWGMVIDHFRYGVLLVGVPMAMILVWSEAVDRLERWARSAHPSLATTLGLGGFMSADLFWEVAPLLVRILGVLVVIAVTPEVLRRLWDTMPMTGSLRERLAGLCRASGVRVRDMLVWRTHGTMANGAVLGFLPWSRYILLTDVLLDHLTARQVEAVMAHEIAHVRRRHMLWLGLTSASTVLAVSVAAEIWLRSAGMPLLRTESGRDWLSLLLGAGSVAAALVAFGFVSRRFEWQADAFAAGRLLALDTAGAGGAAAPVVGRAETEAMIGALVAVAAVNNVPINRNSWRHGSIQVRLARLRSLEGLAPERFPIDAQAAALKAVIALVLVGSIGALAALAGMS